MLNSGALNNGTTLLIAGFRLEFLFNGIACPGLVNIILSSTGV